MARVLEPPIPRVERLASWVVGARVAVMAEAVRAAVEKVGVDWAGAATVVAATAVVGMEAEARVAEVRVEVRVAGREVEAMAVNGVAREGG